MLLELRLRDLAIAADVRLALGPGLNVLTGSTGAGKSLVVEALRWLSGAPLDRGLVRAGSERAVAEALFDLGERPELEALLEELALEIPSDGILHLRREARAGGPSRAFVGGRLSSAAVLATLTGGLIELQSQHQQMALLDPSGHRALLDAGGVGEKTLESYREAREEHRVRLEELREWEARRARLLEEREQLEFQRRELEEASPREGEMEELRARVARLAGGARLLEVVEEARQALEDDREGALGRLGRSRDRLRGVGEELPELRQAAEELDGALDLAQEALRGLQGFLGSQELDPSSLEADEGRLARLEGLCRRYGRTEAELVALRERLERELADLDLEGERPARLVGPLEEARGRLERAARALHRRRREVGGRLADEAAPLLAELGMSGAAIDFRQELEVDPEGPIRVGGSRVVARGGGPARVRLFVRTNPGEPFGPVERMASGGELSRLGLVIRSLARRDRPVALRILDEVDAGLGADLGPALARRLVALAEGTQLLAITHLPAVAAAADRHLVARKASEDERTVSRVEPLRGEARVEELARMLGTGARAVAHARSLLEGPPAGALEEGAAS